MSMLQETQIQILLIATRQTLSGLVMMGTVCCRQEMHTAVAKSPTDNSKRFNLDTNRALFTDDAYFRFHVDVKQFGCALNHKT